MDESVLANLARANISDALTAKRVTIDIHGDILGETFYDRLVHSNLLQGGDRSNCTVRAHYATRNLDAVELPAEVLGAMGRGEYVEIDKQERREQSRDEQETDATGMFTCDGMDDDDEVSLRTDGSAHYLHSHCPALWKDASHLRRLFGSTLERLAEEFSGQPEGSIAFSDPPIIKVAILDTGIDVRHPSLKIFAEMDSVVVKDTISFVDGEVGFMDSQGHGTHVFGCLVLRRSRGLVVRSTSTAPAAWRCTLRR